MAQGSVRLMDCVGHRPWALANKVTIYGLRALTRLFGMRVMCMCVLLAISFAYTFLCPFTVQVSEFVVMLFTSLIDVCVCVFLFFVAFLQSCSQKKTWNLCVVASIEHSLQEFHTAHPLHQLHNKNNITTKNKTNQQQQNYLCVVVRRKLCPVKMRLSDRYKSSSSSSASSASASASTTAIASYQSLSTHIEVIAAAGRLAGVNV